MKRIWYLAAAGVAALLAACAAQIELSERDRHIGANELGGVVTGAQGPEAGVWVIAETTDLPTKFAKIVVTDDRGRYLMPDLPKASYSVWVRGYGLADSPKVQTAPGATLNLKAVPAPSAAAAAQILSADLLVLDAQDPGQERVPHRQGPAPGRVAQHHEVQRLHRVPRARHPGNAHDPEGFRPHEIGRRVGAARAVRPGADADGPRHLPDRRRRACSSCSATGPTASPRASCRSQDRSGRRASSATSCSPSGTGARPPPTCTISSAPTGASPRSSPTASSTARPRTARTTSRCSTRARTRCPRYSTRCATPRRRRARTAPCSPRRTGGTSRSGTARPAFTTR